MKDTKARVLAALALLATPALLLAQTGRLPNGELVQRGYPAQNPDAPKILIGAMSSTTPNLGKDAGDELRNRLRDDHNANDLTVIPLYSINRALEQSGYKTDSALNRNDLIELAKQQQAIEAVYGSVTKLGKDSVRWDATLFIRSGQVAVPQPLPTVTAKDLGAAGKEMEKSVDDAQKQLKGYTDCHNNYLGNKYDLAIKGARDAIVAYPKSTVARLCMLQAMSAMKAPSDSLISTASGILALDSTNTGALAALADAYTAKGDTNSAIATEVKLYNADKSNQQLAQSIVQQLAASGAADKAIPIINGLLKDNPGDPQMLKTKWLLYLRAKDWKDAYTAGDEYVAADTSAANEDFYGRMAAAAGADSNPAKQLEYLARAVKKYPKNVEMELNYANDLYKAGQLQQAIAPTEAALAVDPKNVGGNTLLLVLFTQTNQMDSAMTTGKRAIAAGVNKSTIGDALSAFISPAAKKAQTSNDRNDWMAVYKLASTVDSLAASPTTKFFVGLSAFSIGSAALSEVSELQKAKKPDKAKICEDLNTAKDMWATAQIAMPAGGSVNKDAAGQILTSINQYSSNIDEGLKGFKCK